MKIQKLVYLGLVSATAVLPSLAFAESPRPSNLPPAQQSAQQPQQTQRTQEMPQEQRAAGTQTATEQAAQPPSAPLQGTVQLDERIESALPSGCTYSATVRGSVRPVPEGRGEVTTVQRLRPDLRVAATVRCPNSTEAHIQERRVRSTGVTREEFEQLLQLNASVARMQNTGRCMYVPAMSFDNAHIRAQRVDYLCPSAGGSRGGGPVNESLENNNQRGESDREYERDPSRRPANQ